MSLSYNYPPQMAYPSAPPVYRGLPAPPRLHWGWVFALSLITFGVFAFVWLVVQGWWVKRATGNAKPFWWALAYLLVLPATFLLIVVGSILSATVGSSEAVNGAVGIGVVILRLASFVCYIGAAFTIKGAMESQPIEIPLSGVMTFFFAPIYFQYHLYDYDVEGRVAEQLSGFAEPAVTGVPVAIVEAPEIPSQP